jgi:hypothetical protein
VIIGSRLVSKASGCKSLGGSSPSVSANFQVRSVECGGTI